jgi:hypothetical protein
LRRESRETVCPNVLVKYKDEVDGPLDYAQAGVEPGYCAAAREASNDHDRGNSSSR